MATSVDRNKNLNRPRKGATERARRVKLHRARAIALGVPAAQVEKLDAAGLRALLRRPLETARRFRKA